MIPSEETTIAVRNKISKSTTSIEIVEEENHVETNDVSPEPLAKQENDEVLSLLTIENGGTDKECEIVKKRSNGETNNKKSKHRLSDISITPGHISATHPTSYVETLVNMLKGNIGCGILAMGDAFKNGGLFLSPILTLLIGVTSVYNQHLLVNASRIVKKKFKLDHNPQFAETVELSIKCGPKRFQKYSTSFRHSVDFFIITTQMGVCCIYVLFITTSILQIASWCGNKTMTMHTALLTAILPVLIASLIKNLKFIAWLSIIANVCMVGGLIIILYNCYDDVPLLSSRMAVGNWSNIPLFFGTSIFSFEGISLVLPLEQEMKNPKQFSTPFGALNVGMGIVTGLIMTTGFMGYLKYGDEVKDTLTLNLPDSLLTKIVIVGMMFGIMCTYTLQFYVPVEIIWPAVKKQFGPFKINFLWETGLRIILVLFTFVAADVIPYLSLFISLMGAVASTFLALVFPPLCDMATAGEAAPGSRSRWRTVANVVTLIMAAIGFFTGTYASARVLFQMFQKGSVAN